MYTLITILIVIACVLLIFAVLIQNPKGGGLSSTFGGMSNQILGVKRTTDFLEKFTWTMVISVAVLSLATFFFVGAPSASNTAKPKGALENYNGVSTSPSAPTTNDSTTGNQP